MTRCNDKLPTLNISAPECSHCGDPVEMEDRVAWCPRCHVRWDVVYDGELSRPDLDYDGAETPCAKPAKDERNEYDFKGDHVTLTFHPCILPSRHEGECLNPYDYDKVPL